VFSRLVEKLSQKSVKGSIYWKKEEEGEKKRKGDEEPKNMKGRR
jgi:hypothetical protein